MFVSTVRNLSRSVSGRFIPASGVSGKAQFVELNSGLPSTTGPFGVNEEEQPEVASDNSARTTPGHVRLEDSEEARGAFERIRCRSVASIDRSSPFLRTGKLGRREEVFINTGKMSCWSFSSGGPHSIGMMKLPYKLREVVERNGA